MPDIQPTTGLPVYVQIILASFGALPLLISPIIVWILGRMGVSKDNAAIDYFSKRLDFLERMGKLRTQFAEGPMKPVVETEIEHCQEFLRQPPTFLARRQEPVALPKTRLDRFFLTTPARTTGKRIFKILFYFFFSVALGTLLSFVVYRVLFYNSFYYPPLSTAIRLPMFITFFYLGIALLFRMAAR